MVAVADFEVSATLVARTVTLAAEARKAGDVYHPELLMPPGPDTTLHVTAVLLALMTVAVNCCICEGYIELPEATLTMTLGSTVMVADADVCGAATLVAVTVTVWELKLLEGAV